MLYARIFVVGIWAFVLEKSVVAVVFVVVIFSLIPARFPSSNTEKIYINLKSMSKQIPFAPYFICHTKRFPLLCGQCEFRVLNQRERTNGMSEWWLSKIRCVHSFSLHRLHCYLNVIVKFVLSLFDLHLVIAVFKSTLWR